MIQGNNPWARIAHLSVLGGPDRNTAAMVDCTEFHVEGPGLPHRLIY